MEKKEKIVLLEKENLEYKKNQLLLLESKKDSFTKRYKVIKWICIILYIISIPAALGYIIPIIIIIQLYFKTTLKRKVKRLGFKKIEDFNIAINKLKNNEELDKEILDKIPNNPSYSKQLNYIVNEQQKKVKLNDIINNEKQEEKEKLKNIKNDKVQEENLTSIKEKDIIDDKPKNSNNASPQENNNDSNKFNIVETIGSLIGLIICIVIILNVGSWFGVGSSNINSEQEKYMKTAVEQLKSGKITEYVSGEDAGPIKRLYELENKIIHYGDDVLVQLHFIRTSLTSGEKYYSATFSINRNEFIGQIELENMMYTEEWKNTKVEEVKSDLIIKINKEYFE